MENIKAIVVNGPNGQQEYGIEDAEARENVQEIVEGAPEELDSFKEAFEKFKEGSDALTVIAEDVERNAEAIAAEATRATAAEQALGKAVTNEATRATEAEQAINARVTEVAQAQATALAQATTTLSGAIAAEKTRAEGAEKANADAIAAEKTRAEAVEQALANGIANAPNLALRALFVAAGAEYNDSGTDKTNTTPWGETVTHKAGHYYLNGLGDITEGQMTRIYNRGNFNDADIAPFSDSYSLANNIRTNLPRIGSWNGNLQTYLSRSNNRIEVITLHVARFSISEMCSITFSNTESLFTGSSALSVIDTRCRLVSSNWSGSAFKDCISLKEVRIEKLKNNLVFAQSSQLSKASVLFAVERATPTAPISITLHPEAYSRLAEDADIVAALEAQPLVTLVSA